MRKALFVFLGFATMLTGCCRKAESPVPDKLKTFITLKTMDDALEARTLLTEIRENRITNTIEMLEFSIDCAIVNMEHSTNCDKATQQQVLQGLQLLKEYRKKYPRKNEAVIDVGDERTNNLEITRQALEFLGHN